MGTSIFNERDPDILAALPLEKLNTEIARCLFGCENGGTSQGRKAFFKRLVMLEQLREETHGIPSRHRTFGAR